jgi:hypothetical protein
MKKVICAVLAMASSMGNYAQNDQSERFVRRGLFRSESSFEVGSMLSQRVTHVYLQGGIEYYISDNVSIRGDGSYFITGLGDMHPFAYHHDLFSGASYHFKTKNHFDPYVGMAPGISITALNNPYYIICDPGPCTGEEIAPGEAHANPLASIHAGYNLYFQRWFHLFMETRYIYGRHYSNYYPESLSELRFSFGLGWNFNLIKKDKP